MSVETINDVVLTLIPVGTPVLAQWKNEYFPAIIIDYDSRRLKYRAEYCDGTAKWVKRGEIITTDQAEFASAPIPPIESIEQSNKASKRRRRHEPLDLPTILDASWDHLYQIIGGKIETRRRKLFFSGHKERSQLLREIKTGPLTFEEYYQLSDLLQSRVQSEVPRDKKVMKRLVSDAKFYDEAAINSLLRQLASFVLLPEMLLHHIEGQYPGCDPEDKLVTLWQDASKDYVEYLLARRDLVHWGSRHKL